MSVPGGNTNPQWSRPAFLDKLHQPEAKAATPRTKQQRRLLMFSIPTALVAITLVIVLIACGPSAGVQ